MVIFNSIEAFIPGHAGVTGVTSSMFSGTATIHGIIAIASVAALLRHRAA